MQDSKTEEKVWYDYLPPYCFTFYEKELTKIMQGKHTFRVHFDDGNEKLKYGTLIDVCKYLFYLEKDWEKIWLIETAPEYDN